MNKIANEVNSGESYLGKKLILVADIDLQSISNWSPIGSGYDNPFKGEFDGNGYSISGMKIITNDKGYVGLFGYTNNAIISNIRLRNSNITISNINQYISGYADAHVGFILGGAYSDENTGYSCKITNCTVESNCKIAISNSDRVIIGGIIGLATERVTIQDCQNFGNIETSSNNAGGIVRIWN